MTNRYLVCSESSEGEILYEAFDDFAAACAFCRETAEEGMRGAVFSQVLELAPAASLPLGRIYDPAPGLWPEVRGW